MVNIGYLSAGRAEAGGLRLQADAVERADVEGPDHPAPAAINERIFMRQPGKCISSWWRRPALQPRHRLAVRSPSELVSVDLRASPRDHL
jgi:hypothetical protein